MAARQAGRRARTGVRRLTVVTALAGVAMCGAPVTGLALADGTDSTPGSCGLPPVCSPPPETPPPTSPAAGPTPTETSRPSASPSAQPSATATATATRSRETSTPSASAAPTTRRTSGSASSSGATSFPATKITPAPTYDPAQLEALAQSGDAPDAGGTPATVSAASASDSAADPIGTVLLLTIVLAAALGVAGGAGLYLTRSRPHE